ncbi:hypothetical protein BY458DRAFT_523681, partial [Sporodiniella umbellata]
MYYKKTLVYTSSLGATLKKTVRVSNRLPFIYSLTLEPTKGPCLTFHSVHTQN